MVSNSQTLLDKKAIISFLKKNKSTLDSMGVLKIGLFGSFARGTQGPDSDIDFFVDLDVPSYNKLMFLILFLEDQLGRPVDVVRMGPHVKDSFLHFIESDISHLRGTGR